MAKKTLIKSQAGVRLERIEELTKGQKARSRFMVSTYRPPQPRQFGDLAAAEEAFELEVIASLMDPVVLEMQRRGLIE